MILKINHDRAYTVTSDDYDTALQSLLEEMFASKEAVLKIEIDGEPVDFIFFELPEKTFTPKQWSDIFFDNVTTNNWYNYSCTAVGLALQRQAKKIVQKRLQKLETLASAIKSI